MFMCMAFIDDEEDKKAFAELFNKYKIRAISLAYRILKRKDLAENACSESFLNIAKCFETVKNLEDSQLDSYVFSVVTNTSKNMYTSEKKYMKVVPLDDDFTELTDDELSKKSIFADDIKQCVLKLSEKDREILYLRCVLGLTHNDIANSLHISDTTSRKRLQTARDNLLMLLEKEDIYNE